MGTCCKRPGENWVSIVSLKKRKQRKIRRRATITTWTTTFRRKKRRRLRKVPTMLTGKRRNPNTFRKKILKRKNTNQRRRRKEDSLSLCFSLAFVEPDILSTTAKEGVYRSRSLMPFPRVFHSADRRDSQGAPKLEWFLITTCCR